MSQLFDAIVEAVRAYGSTLVDNPVMRVHFDVEPVMSDVDLSEWNCRVTLECLGEIVDDTPKITNTVRWEGSGKSIPIALIDLHEKVQEGLAAKYGQLMSRASAIEPFLIMAEPEEASPRGKTVEIEATLHRR